jgi:hypothetical protein
VGLEQEQPGVDRPGHGGGERAGTGHEVEALRREVLRRRAGRRGALTHQHDRAAGLLRRREHAGHIAARAVQVRFDEVQHEGRRDRRVEGVPTPLQHRLRGRRGEPMGGGAHPERALQVGTGRELGRRRERHDPSLHDAAVTEFVLGRLTGVAAADRPDLLAHPTLAALTTLGLLEVVGVAAIDPTSPTPRPRRTPTGSTRGSSSTACWWAGSGTGSRGSPRRWCRRTSVRT